jgi:hypothetical protein
MELHETRFGDPEQKSMVRGAPSQHRTCHRVSLTV